MDAQARPRRAGPPAPPSAGQPAPALRVAPPARERRPTLAVAGALFVVVCGAVLTALYVHAGGRSEVLAVARTVPIGHQIAAGDLQRVRISTDPALHAIPAAAAADVVGRIAGTTLLPGTLLTPEQLGTSQVPQPNQAIVGLDLKGAQMPVPADQLPPGATVRIITTPSPNSTTAAATSAGGSGLLVDQAVVYSVQPSETGDTVHVAVVVGQADLAKVLNAATLGQVGLAVIPATASGS